MDCFAAILTRISSSSKIRRSSEHCGICIVFSSEKSIHHGPHWKSLAKHFETRFRSDNGMKFQVTIYRDEDSVWIVECPAIPGCVSQGDTRAKALRNIADAIKHCLEVRAERGMPLTVETSQVEVVA